MDANDLVEIRSDLSIEALSGKDTRLIGQPRWICPHWQSSIEFSLEWQVAALNIGLLTKVACL